MTIQEAEKILGISSQNEERKIKIRFRSLMAKYHPDAIQSDEPEHIKRAQMINEAYTVIRKQIDANKKKEKKQNIQWNAKIKKNAFAERIIFMSNGFGEEHESGYYQVAKGRYEWEPELEEFDCFLHSILHLSLNLLEQAEEKLYTDNNCYISTEELKEIRLPFQIRLFHLLAGQYVTPISSLRKIAEPECREEEKEIYCFDTFLGMTEDGVGFHAMEKLRKGDMIYVSSMENNRINVIDDQRNALGHLSFADDQLYYVVIPILRKHQAQVKCIVKEMEIRRNRRFHQVKANIQLYIRIDKSANDTESSDVNLAIASIFNEYDKMLMNKAHEND